MPEAYAELVRIKDTLEKRFRDMQDLEFTIEDEKLYLLQTRNGKRTGFAAVRIATDMVDEGLIDPEEAVARVEPEQLVQLLAPIFPTKEKAAAVKDGRLHGQGPAGRARRGVRPHRADRRARRRDGGEGRDRSSSCARRPRPRTSPACTPRRAS